MKLGSATKDLIATKSPIQTDKQFNVPRSSIVRRLIRLVFNRLSWPFLGRRDGF